MGGGTGTGFGVGEGVQGGVVEVVQHEVAQGAALGDVGTRGDDGVGHEGLLWVGDADGTDTEDGDGVARVRSGAHANGWPAHPSR